MVLSQSALSHLTGMILGKNYEEKWRNNPRGEGKPLLYTDISRTERPKRKKPKFKKSKSFKKWRESMETLSLANQNIDKWLKE